MSEDITHAKPLNSYHFPRIPIYHGHLSSYQACERKTSKSMSNLDPLKNPDIGHDPSKGIIIKQKLCQLPHMARGYNAKD